MHICIYIFINNKVSVIKTLNTLDKISSISGLKSNSSKCKIAGVGVLIQVKVVLYELKNF